MTCPEERLIAFLTGELSPEQEREFDQHLLECETCWRQVQADRVGRLAVERLTGAGATGAPRPSLARRVPREPGNPSHRAAPPVRPTFAAPSGWRRDSSSSWRRAGPLRGCSPGRRRRPSTGFSGHGDGDRRRSPVVIAPRR